LKIKHVEPVLSNAVSSQTGFQEG